MAKQSPLTYIPEVSGQERPDTNVQTEEALNTLLEALERRRAKPMFDPVGLATAGGFMKPTRTGSGFEALSNAIEAYTGARQGQRQEEIENAQQYLGVVGQLGEIERRKRRDKQFQTSLGMGPETTLGKAPGASPAEEEINVRTPKAAAYAPPGFEGQAGTKVGPGDPNLPTGEEFMASAKLEGKLDHSEALLKAAELERNRYAIGTWGAYDKRSGFLFEFPKGELVERQIFGSTYKIPSTMASQLDFYQFQGDRENYNKIANRALNREEVPSAQPSVSAQKQAPSTRPGAPTGPSSGPSGALKSEAQRKEEALRREKRAEEETKIDVEAEAALGANSKSAREMFSAAQRLQKAAELSPNVFGLLQAPTIGSALLTLIRDGIQAGNTSIRIGGFEKALILSYPGVKKEDIKNLEIGYSALAEIELKYTQLYLKGQGQVTEGERLIVRKLGGTPENSPEFLRGQAKLIQMRSQYDIDVIDTFQRLKDQNPDITWTQFQRSPAYREIENDYNKKLAKEFDLEPAIPTNKRDSSGTKFPEVEDFQKKLQQRRSGQ